MTYIDDRDDQDRQYVSQWANDALVFEVMKSGSHHDVDEVADDDDLWIDLVREDDDSLVFHRPATWSSTGVYETHLSSDDSATPGHYTLVWRYWMSGVQQEYRTYIEIGPVSPDYDRLCSSMKELISTVWIRFADLYDSPSGGPNLMTYYQTHFNRQRLAQLLRIAIGTLNTVAQPHMTYTLCGDGGQRFPYHTWGPLLERSLFIEALKHLIRSYVEQPMFVGGAVTRLDRRDYIDRWNIVLSMEEPVFQRQMEVFKIAHMGLGKPAALVAGGIYGRRGYIGGNRHNAARPNWTRWH